MNPFSTVIIDDSELGLHPSAITVLADMLRLAEEKSQLIVSTQSSPLVDHLQIEDLIIVHRVGALNRSLQIIDLQNQRELDRP